MLNSTTNILRKHFDPNYAEYLGDVPNRTAAIQRAVDAWSEALYECAKTVSPASATALAARSAFESAAVGMYASGTVFSLAVKAFADALGGGMSGYTAVSPASLFIPTSASEVHEIMCQGFSTQLIAWFSTGTATMISPPNSSEAWS